MSDPKAKMEHSMTDMKRWASYFDIPFKWPNQFPINTLKPLRITLQLDEPSAFIHRVYRAYWAEGRDISSPDVLTELLRELDLPRDLLQRTAEPAIKKALIDATQRAIERGVFGAPTCIVGDDLFFGQDRFQFVLNALKRHAT